MLKKGEITFLDGDIVHAGGIVLSGLRCHGFIYDSKHDNSRINTYHCKGNKAKSLNTECLIPFSDNQPYQKEWFKKQLSDIKQK